MCFEWLYFCDMVVVVYGEPEHNIFEVTRPALDIH